MYDLQRFVTAQEAVYEQALREIDRGRKQTHWMWFIFPQLKGLGRSDTAQYYGIENLEEATAYLQHPILGPHLIEISNHILAVSNKTATQLMGSPDDLKLHACMTLFGLASGSDTVFPAVVTKYFDGLPHTRTLALLHA